MVDEAWNHLREDGVGMMGMYGMDGVGKTTLLTQINNRFSKDMCGFDFVFWIEVSKELHVEKIQDKIANKVGLHGGDWNQKDRSEKVEILFNFLKTKRFVLLLDDIWDEVDLAKIGVPNPTPENRCKVAFTTRSMDVCARMRVKDPMEVKCLADNDAFDLFQKFVGQTTLGSDPGIPDLARIVAKKCSGLPLALKVIGKAMSDQKTIQGWRHAIKELNSCAAEFSDMEDTILPLLKYSYDSLKGKGLKGKEQIQKCLLYCALFPEDHKIRKEELIEYWVCEGIIVIDGSDQGIENAANEGDVKIGKLVSASLLMKEVDSDGDAWVYMHDVVREMALWIASDLGKEKEAFIVRAGVGLREIPKVNWNVVKRMSLMKNEIVHLPGSPECLQLTTLLLQDTKLESISSEFFKSMPKLAVLDLSENEDLFELPDGISKLVSLQYLNLSGTDIPHLPDGISKLVSLQSLNLSFTGIRQLPKGLQELKQLIHLDLELVVLDLSSNRGLTKLPDGILKLVSLQYLNLSETRIRHLPMVLQELKQLIHLDLERTNNLSNIAGISSLHNLNVLKLFNSRFRWDLNTVKELETFEHLEILTTTIYRSSGAGPEFLSSHRLMSRSRILQIWNCNMESSGISLPQDIDMLRKLSIRESSISEIKMGRKCSFFSLVEVKIDSCKCLRELTFLMFAPNLRKLMIGFAEELEDIINKEKACEVEKSGIVPFQKLIELRLGWLWQLKSIYWSPLPFPCLEGIYVYGCPNLKKLPLDSKSCKQGENGFIIEYSDQEWSEGMEWEDEATKIRFSSCLKYNP